MESEKVFPFDFDTLLAHLNSDDHLALVIRAHLYAEASLTRLIEGAFIEPSMIDTARLVFSKKTELAAALGLIDPESLKALGCLNAIRNRFAHDLTTKLTDKDEARLYASLTVPQRILADKTREKELIVRIRSDLIAIILTASFRWNRPKTGKTGV